MQSGEQKVIKFAGYECGELHIGASETPLYHFLFPILNNFKLKFPNVHITVTGHTINELITNLDNGSIDIALILSPKSLNEKFTSIHLRDFQDIFVTLPDFPTSEDKVYSLVEVSKYPIIALEKGTSFRQHINDWFKLRGIQFTPDYSVHSTSMILPFVRQGWGIGIVPLEFAENEINEKKLKRLFVSEEIPARHLYVSYNKELPVSTLSNEFINSLLSWEKL